jgi:hypothetical protein
MRYSNPLVSTLCALSLFCAVAPGRAGTNLVFNGVQASGANWSQAIWKTNNGLNVGIGTAVAPVAGNTYTVISNAVRIGNNLNEARVRCPVVGFLTNFPGDSLTLTTNTEIRFKTATGLICGFPGVGGNPGLILSGGMLNAGDDAIFTIAGKMQSTAGTYSYICPGNNDLANAVVARAFTINAQLSGSGTIVLIEAFTNNPQKFASLGNTFSGQWIVKAGLLQGAAQDALGTNSTITVDPNYTLAVPPFTNNFTDVAGPGVVEALYNINSAGTLTLTNGGKMRLHGEACFTAVTIEGNALSPGVHFFANLVAAFPNNFDPGGSGALVVQPYGTPPPLPPTILVQPRPQEVFAGDTTRLTLTAADNGFPPLTYHWRRDGTNLSDIGNISGSTNAVLVVKTVSAADLANYDVVVANASASITSAVTTITIVAPSGEPYEAAVLAANPVAFYELNETTVPSSGNAQAFDFVGGYAGLYGTSVGNGSTPVNGPQTSDGFPGFATGNFAAQFVNLTAGSSINVLPWNLNTNTVTITAWLNPSGVEASDGLVFCRGGATVAGLAYGADGSLGYNWNNEQPAYGWSSGLVPPLGQWSFVALVVTPTNATIYLLNANTNIAAQHVYKHIPQAFDGLTLIGEDPFDNGTGSRSFSGIIDDVAVFNQALSATQLLNLYSAAASSTGTTNLPPEIGVEPPVSTNLFQGQTVSFTALAVGTAPLTYQWQAGGTGLGVFTNLTDGGQFSGSGTPTLTVANLDLPNSADYIVVVANAFGTVTSSIATLTVQATNAPEAVTMAVQQATGFDWDNAAAPNNWSDNNSASVSAAEFPGSTYEVLPGARLRSPQNPITATFPGNSLKVSGDGVWNLNPGAGATIGEVRFKQPTYLAVNGAVNFKKLVMNGGQLDVGNDNVLILGGEIDILTNTPFNNDGGTDRGYRVDAQLTGSGGIEYHGYNQPSFMTTYSNNLNVACPTNTFSGTWNVVSGVLLGTAPNALGTNTILIGTNAALETTYNMRNTNATLVLNGRMFLHQDNVFRSALINGKSLAIGSNTIVTLNSLYPNTFPINWNPQNGAANFSTASGSITVLTNAGPVILGQPQSLTLWGQQNAQFGINAIGDLPLAYQWQAGVTGSGTYTNLTDGGQIAGSTNAILNITNVAVPNALDYIVIITNIYGVATSRVATLTIRPGPTITTTNQPQSLTLYEQQTAQFSVGTLGLLPITYQWQAGVSGSGIFTNLSEGGDGGKISGTGTTNLTIVNIGPENAGDYQFIVSNAGGSVTSIVATLTVLPISPAEHITLNFGGVPIQEAQGQDWNTANSWSDGQAASVSAVQKPGSTYEIVAGARLRTPTNSSSVTFPGLMLTNSGSGIWVNNNDATIGELRFKHNSAGTALFKRLVMNGGQLDQGDNTMVTIQGEMDILANAPIYVDSAAAQDRAYQIDAFVTGSGSIELHQFGNSLSADFNITCPTNTFSGKWNVVQGCLLGSGLGCLGTNTISVGANGALETLYSLNNPNANLLLLGQLLLHTNDTFGYVAVNGFWLAAGTYTFAQLNAAYPANFPASWPQQIGSPVSSGSGTLTVLHTGSTLSAQFNGVNLQLTWAPGVLLDATNLAGPWNTNTAATSPFIVAPTDPQHFYRVLVQ